MASFLRARQAGIQNDLSAGIAPGAFNPDELARYGINSQIRYVFIKLISMAGYYVPVPLPSFNPQIITKK